MRRHTVVFVVRVWAEYRDQTPARWVGEVEAIREGEKAYFHNLDELVAIITAQVSEPPACQEEFDP